MGLATFASVQTHYNSIHYEGSACRQNETIRLFQFSFKHLIDGKNLYIDHHEDHCFTYKYSPAFALFFGIFAYMPSLTSLWLWSMVSVGIGFWALRALPGMAPPQQFLFFLFTSFESLLCMQAQQTNILVAALLILALAFLERRKYLPATLFIVLTGFIKLFGFGAMLLYLFYPQKLKLGLFSLGWIVALALLPLVVVGPTELWGIYGDWYTQIIGDHSKYAGMSFYGMVGAFSGIEPSKSLFLGISLLLMGATILQYKKWQALWFRQSTLAMLLIWMVIFNHKAESPSYVIAMFGMALWFFSDEREWGDIILFLLAFAAVSLVFSDITPKWIRKTYAYPYHLKALPCLVVWLRVMVDMWLRPLQRIVASGK